MDFDVLVRTGGAAFETHLQMINPYCADMLGFLKSFANAPRRWLRRSEYAEMGIDALLQSETYALVSGVTKNECQQRRYNTRLNADSTSRSRAASCGREA